MKRKLTRKKINNIKNMSFISSISLCLIFSLAIILSVKFNIFADVPDKTAPVDGDTVLYTSSDGHEYKISDPNFLFSFDISKAGDNSMIIAYFDYDGDKDNTPEDIVAVYYGVGELYEYDSYVSKYMIEDGYIEDGYYCVYKTFLEDQSEEWVEIDANLGFTEKNDINFANMVTNNADLNYRRNNFAPWTIIKNIQRVYAGKFKPYGNAAALFCSEDAIYNYNELCEIDLDKLDTSEVTNMDYMFYNFNSASGDVYFEIGNLDTRKVTSMYYTFNNTNSRVKNVDVQFGKNFSFDKVERLERTFFYFAQLSENVNIVFPDRMSFSNVVNANYAFYSLGTTAKEKVNIKFGNNTNFSKCESMEYMFAYVGGFVYDSSCGIVNIDLGDNFNASSCKNMKYMFYHILANGDDAKLTINLGKNFNASSCENMSYMFYDIANNSSRSATIDIDLGDNFNACECLTMAGMFLYTNLLVTENTTSRIYLGKNFNAIKCTNMISMFSNTFRNIENNANVIIDFGDNFNSYIDPVTSKKASSVTDASMFMYQLNNVSGPITSGKIDIDFGKGAIFNNVIHGDSFFKNVANYVKEFNLTIPNGIQMSCVNISQMEYIAMSASKVNVVFGTKGETEEALNIDGVKAILSKVGTDSPTSDINIEISGDIVLGENVDIFMPDLGNDSENSNVTITINGDMHINYDYMDPVIQSMSNLTVNMNGDIHINASYIGNLFEGCSLSSLTKCTINMTGKIYFDDPDVTYETDSLIHLYSNKTVSLSDGYKEYYYRYNDIKDVEIGTKDLTRFSVFDFSLSASKIRETKLFKDVMFDSECSVDSILNYTVVDKFYLLKSGPKINVPIKDTVPFFYDYYYCNDSDEKLEKITDGFIKAKENGAPAGATYVMQVANQIGNYKQIDMAFDTASDVLREVELAYKCHVKDKYTNYMILESNYEFDASYADGTDIYAPGTRTVNFTGKGTYENLNASNSNNSYDYVITAHKIDLSELTIEGYSKNNPVTKEDDNASNVKDIELVYINPVNGEKIYFDYDKAVYTKNGSEVTKGSNDILDIKFINVKARDGQDDKLTHYDMTNFSSPSNLTIKNIGKINVKPNNNNGSGGGSKKKKDEPKKEVEETKKYKQIMEGYSDGSFKPQNYLTRAEFAAIICRLDENYDENADYTSYLDKYDDIDKNTSWAYNYLGYLTKVKIYEGYKNKLRASDEITRGEVSKILCIFKGYNYSYYKDKLPDLPDTWYNNYASTLYVNKVIDGRKEGVFDGEANIKRSETAKMIANIASLNNIDIKDTVLDIHYNDVKEKDWFYDFVYEVSKKQLIE